MSKILYALTVFAESGLSVFGIRGAYEQPAYTVVQTIAPAVEIRAYGARTAVQTDIQDGDQGQAFGRLFRYITGANPGTHRMAMTVPVEMSGGAQVMGFYLPQSVVTQGVPTPSEPGVRIAVLPAATLGVIQFSGTATADARAAQTALLRAALAKSGHATQGAPLYFSYDPPFSFPFLRRNEVALALR